MRILRGSITQLASEGYITIQIPNVAISLGPIVPIISTEGSGFSEEEGERLRNWHPEYEEVPDEWIVVVHSSCRRYCLTNRERQHGFLHLTRAGFEANREALLQALRSARYCRGTWEDFCSHAEDEWRKLEAGTERYRENLRRKAAQVAG